MATLLDNELRTIQAKTGLLARDEIGSRPDLALSLDFPWNIWEKMRDAGLFGMGIVDEFGERGQGCMAQTVTLEAFVRHGGNMGLAVSLALHWIAAGAMVLKHGNFFQNQAFLPGLSDGSCIGALGFSEAGGTHPSAVQTSAAREGNSWVINGEKNFITNGPLADLFVITAKTGADEGGGLTAFLIPVDTPGLTVSKPFDIGFLYPAPHGKISLHNVRIPEGNMLGKVGQAWETMVRPLRQIEDVMFMGALAGGLARQLDIAAELAAQSAIPQDDRLSSGMGRLLAISDTLRILAYKTARLSDSGGDQPELTSLLITARQLVRTFEDEFGPLLSGADIKQPPHLEALARDIVETNRIAQDIIDHKQAKLGKTLLGS